MRLAGKVAFISGGSRGIGAEVARLFSREGARVAIGDIREKEGRGVASEIHENGRECLYVPLDVTSTDGWSRAISSTVEKFGKVNVLVNSAGISEGGTVEATTVPQWERVMDVNARGVFLGIRTTVPEMRRAGGGSIINIASQLGLVGVADASTAYQASKAAVRLLTKAVAIQYAKEGIRVNSVCPGPTVTPMTQARFSDPVGVKQSLSGIPLGRLGRPEDVAYGVLYLASEESSFVTGTDLMIDGGWTAR